MKERGKVYKKTRDMVSREIDNDMILMPIYARSKSISEMYTLNETARKMWELIDGKRNLKEITDELHAGYNTSRETIEASLAEFIKDMKEIKAIERGK